MVEELSYPALTEPGPGPDQAHTRLRPVPDQAQTRPRPGLDQSQTRPRPGPDALQTYIRGQTSLAMRRVVCCIPYTQCLPSSDGLGLNWKDRPESYIPAGNWLNTGRNVRFRPVVLAPARNLYVPAGTLSFSTSPAGLASSGRKARVSSRNAFVSVRTG